MRLNKQKNNSIIPRISSCSSPLNSPTIPSFQLITWKENTTKETNLNYQFLPERQEKEMEKKKARLVEIMLLSMMLICVNAWIGTESTAEIDSYRRLLLENGLGATPPMGYILLLHANKFFALNERDKKCILRIIFYMYIFYRLDVFNCRWNSWNHFFCNIDETIIKDTGT